MTQLRFGTVLAVALANVIALAAHAGVSVGSTFTYQGELRDRGELVSDTLPMTFRLFDLPVGGVQLGGDYVIGAVPVVDGRFTVLLDFGAQFNTTAARFLEIEVNGTLLGPRQQVTAAPLSLFSLNTRGITVDSQLDVGIGVGNPIYKLQVETSNRSIAVYGNNLDESAGTKYGVFGRAAAATGYGVYGWHSATTGTAAGVVGETDSTSQSAIGVHGLVSSTSAGSFSAAVRGENKGTSVSGIGVWGSQDGSGWGVYGEASGIGRGVFGQCNGTGGYGGYFSNDDGVGLYVSGTENTGSTAALVVHTTANNMYIDGNEINSTGSTGLFLNNNNDFNVVLAAGGGNVNLPDASTFLNVAGSAEVAGQLRAAVVIAGYNSGNTTYISRCESDSGNQVTHFKMEATGIVGTITSFNGNVSYNAFTGSHYVTLRQAVEPGTLMRMTGVNEALMDDRPSEPVYGVEETYQANDPACLGAYVALHDEVTTSTGAPIHLVAAVGNGLLAVVDDGRGAIEPGDLLISSDVPGCAMKDDPARFETSYVIARAAERVDWSQVEAGADGVKRRAISVLFNATVRSGSANEAALRAQLEALAKRLESLEQR